MGIKTPILRQAVADQSGFKLYSFPAREWSHVAVMSATSFVCLTLLAHRNLIVQIVFWPLTLIAVSAILWLKRARFELTVDVLDRRLRSCLQCGTRC